MYHCFTGAVHLKMTLKGGYVRVKSWRLRPRDSCPPTWPELLSMWLLHPSQTASKGKCLDWRLSLWLGCPYPVSEFLGWSTSSNHDSRFLLMDTLGDSSDGTSTWVSIIHRGDLDWVSNCWLQSTEPVDGNPVSAFGFISIYANKYLWNNKGCHKKAWSKSPSLSCVLWVWNNQPMCCGFLWCCLDVKTVDFHILDLKTCLHQLFHYPG